ncbi:LexA family transcriptional regulator [Achromobacter denitrificans]|uniref:LexA family transcriptional regulator n=1 Tax=Achromobacter denitrificans TaxID=32002 RepID=UPI00242D792D|nr:LexA family transcriptional regulator [Achromobacter denitrificans]MBV2161392.1 helix-turn-helix domain-containing protein [Achromobacter denitrificans]
MLLLTLLSQEPPNTFGERLKVARKAADLTQKQAAEKAGMSQGTLSGLENDVSTSSTYTTRLAHAYGVNARWLADGVGAPHISAAEAPTSAASRRLASKIHVVGYARLGENGWYEEIHERGADGFVEAHSSDPDAYALRVRGDSMFPAIRDGWFVVVEPNTCPASGEYVAIALRDGRKMVKEFLFQGADAYTVQSVNGGTRLTLPTQDVQLVHAIGSVLMPSKYREF